MHHGRMKMCSRCKVTHPLDAFSKTRKTKSGRVAYCRASAKADYEALPEVAPVMDGEWTCWDCGDLKHVTLFPLHKKAQFGRHRLCKACHNRRAKAYRADNTSRAKEIELRVRLKKFYGITPEQYASLLEAQGGGCDVCGKTSEEEGRRLAVDHDHDCCPGKTSCGKCIRAILCADHNTGFGKFNHDPILLRRAADIQEAYLLRRSQD